MSIKRCKSLQIKLRSLIKRNLNVNMIYVQSVEQNIA
jgi:hypothetical protein